MTYKLVCFDLDGTLLRNVKFSWQLFHDHFKIDPEKREQAKQAFKRGDISYIEWAQHDIGMWKEAGATKQDFFDAIDHAGVTLITSAKEVIQELKNKGMKVAIISGSLNVMIQRFIPDCDEIFDDIYISKITFDQGGAIVDIHPTEYDMEHKATALKEIAQKENIPLSQCVFVGDYLNDLQAMKTAGLSIALNANSEEVKKTATKTLETDNLRDILPFIL